MCAIKAYLPLLARLLMSSLFIWDGVLQLRDLGGSAKYFAHVHVPFPDVAIWISISIHLLGGLGILLGFKIRSAAAVLFLFCLGTAFGIHLPAGGLNNMIHFYKNLVMAGGFLYVLTYGAGAMSIDGVDKAKRSADS
jgi:putative oxidoreductase